MIDAHAAGAEHAITRVLHRYCRAMDRIDAELGYTVWHPAGLADYGPVFDGTGRGFIDWVCSFHRTLDAHSHQIANALIDVDGDVAVSETYVTVALLATVEERRVVTTGRGRYLDEWSHRDGRWAIDRRRYVHDFSVKQVVDVNPGWGRRDAADPSYALLGAAGSV